MSAFFPACAALLLSAPLATLAQTPAPAPTHRFYAGLALYVGNNLSLTDYQNRFSPPVQVTLGYQLRPRLALQLGLAYNDRRYSNSYADDYLASNTIPVHYESTYSSKQRTVLTSLLARYTLTRQANRRFQVDVVGGLALENSFLHANGTSTQVKQGVTSSDSYDYDDTYNFLRANLGPSFRYRFGERLDAVGDVLFNTSLTSSYHRPNMSVALGLRYHFGPS